MAKRIGFYGGTFDPIHFGHLNTAIEIMEHHDLDEVWFCPAQVNPHKKEMQSASPSDRLKMLKLALEDLPHFKVLSHELDRQGPSYTIDTVKELIVENPESRFFLLLGEDSLLHFDQWKDAEELIKLATPLVAKRIVSSKSIEFKGNSQLHESLRRGITPINLMEISATRVRERIAKGLYVGHLVPAKVIDYIYQNQLYLI